VIEIWPRRSPDPDPICARAPDLIRDDRTSRRSPLRARAPSAADECDGNARQAADLVLSGPSRAAVAKRPERDDRFRMGQTLLASRAGRVHAVACQLSRDLEAASVQRSLLVVAARIAGH